MRLRTLLLVAASLAALVGGLWYWRKSEETAARRLETWHEQERIDATVAALDRRYEWPAGEVSLAKLAALIDKTSGLAVDLDRLAIESEGKKFDSYRFDIPGSTLSVASLLRLTVESHGLAYDVHDGRIAITTQDASRDRNRLRTVVYPLPQPEPSAARVPEEQWYELITTLIEPENWVEVGGRGHCETVPGGLVIVHYESAHRKIKSLIESMARLLDSPSQVEPIRLEAYAGVEADGPLIATLRKPSNIKYDDLPLQDLLRDAATHLPLVVDWHALTEARIQLDAPLSTSAPFDTWEALFQYVEQQYSVRSYVGDGVFVVTSEDAYFQSPVAMPTVAYPTADLLFEPANDHTDSLLELITTIVVADTWVDVGGTGTITAEIRGWLVVRQSREVHEQIEDLLGQLRLALAYEDHPRVMGIGRPTPTETRIREALDREIPLVLKDVALQAGMQQLADSLQIPITVDQAELAGLRNRMHERVSCDFPLARVHYHLPRVLLPLGLSYRVTSSALVITSLGSAEGRQCTRLYDTRALTDPDLGAISEDQLAELVTTTLDENWDKGGSGLVRYFRGVMAVSQTDHVHYRIAELLSLIETNCLTRPVAGMEQPWVVELYPDPASVRLEALLAQPVKLKLTATTPYAGLMQVAEQAGISVVIVNNCLTETLEPTLSIAPVNETELTLAAVLERILVPCDLHYIVEHGQLVVAHSIEAESSGRAKVRLYRTDDMPAGIADSQSALIARLAKETSAADQFDHEIRPVGKRWLCVSGSSELHERVADVLTHMRTGELPRREVDRRKLAEELKAANELRIETETDAFFNFRSSDPPSPTPRRLMVDPFAP